VRDKLPFTLYGSGSDPAAVRIVQGHYNGMAKKAGIETIVHRRTSMNLPVKRVEEQETLRDVILMFKNFAGKEKLYNEEGQRNFSIWLTENRSEPSTKRSVILRMISNVRGVGAGPSAVSSSANTAACESAITLAYRLKPNPDTLLQASVLQANGKDFLIPPATG